jgi:peptidoglycan/xylan/chitin deacetylase (PgdA/CDA1 family)
LTHGNSNAPGQYLTVDLCPSKRPFEQSFFESVATLSQPQPVPVTVAITGAWLISHEREFSWLREQERLGKLAITWVNHSLTHPYDATAPLQRTFLLTPGLDLRNELLALETLLLERDVVPAPFFRFPGLVADEEAMQLVRELGMIPLGSDAWLAKGEHPRGGSIMLVHGNGNEPAGMRRFQELRQKPGLLRLLPLPQAVVDSRSR